MKERSFARLFKKPMPRRKFLAASFGLTLGVAALACGKGKLESPTPAIPINTPTPESEILLPPTPDIYCQRISIVGEKADIIPDCLTRIGYEIISQEKPSQVFNLEKYQEKTVVLTIFSSNIQDSGSEVNLRSIFTAKQEADFEAVFIESGRQKGLNSESIIVTDNPVLHQALRANGDLYLLNQNLPERTPAGVRPGTDAPLTFIIGQDGLVRGSWRGPVPEEEFTQALVSSK